MAEYIEKQDIYDAIDLLMTRFPYKVPGRPDTYHPYNEAWADACSYALDLIRHHPPADVRPVVRGRWIVHYDDIWPTESTQECSECHEEVPLLIDCKFCPNCGADMRGDAE